MLSAVEAIALPVSRVTGVKRRPAEDSIKKLLDCINAFNLVSRSVEECRAVEVKRVLEARLETDSAPALDGR